MGVRRAIIACVLFGLGGLPVTPASAQGRATDGAAAPDPHSEARVLFDEGRALVAQGSYDDAVSKFEQSLAIVDNPATAVNLGIALAQAGRLTDAIARFESLLASDELSDGQRVDLGRRLSEARDAMARVLVRVRGVASAEVLIDDRAVGTVTDETPAIFLVDPGTRDVGARVADGRAWESLRVELGLGAEEEVRFDAAALVGEEPMAPSETEGPDVALIGVDEGAAESDDGGIGAGWWIAGGVIVAAAVAVVLAIVLTSGSSGPPVVGSAVTLSAAR